MRGNISCLVVINCTIDLSYSVHLPKGINFLSSFPQIVMAIANADIANATLKERWTFATPTPLVARKMAALLQVILGYEQIGYSYMYILGVCRFLSWTCMKISLCPEIII